MPDAATLPDGDVVIDALTLTEPHPVALCVCVVHVLADGVIEGTELSVESVEAVAHCEGDGECEGVAELLVETEGIAVTVVDAVAQAVARLVVLTELQPHGLGDAETDVLPLADAFEVGETFGDAVPTRLPEPETDDVDEPVDKVEGDAGELALAFTDPVRTAEGDARADCDAV